MENKNNSIVCLVMSFIQIILFISAVYLPITLGVDMLPIKSIISLSFDWVMIIIMMCLFQNCRRGRIMKTTHEFLQLVFMENICLCFESGAWLVDGIPGLVTMNYVCNIGANASLLLGVFFYYRYLCKSFDIKDNPGFKFFYFTRIGVIAGIAAEVFNVLCKYFYVITPENSYVRAEFGSILGYIPFAVILLICFIIILMQKIDRRTKFNYLLYIIIPVAVSIWYTVTGIPPTFYVASAFGIVLVYGNTYIALGHDVAYLEAENKKKEAELALERNRLMISQIRPHFLYNTLGSIEILCKVDPEKARKAIHHFSKYLRSNMDIVAEENVVSISRELEHIRNYVWLEHMRFDERLNFKEIIEADNFMIPPLSVQPLVENAIKHGMMGKEDGTIEVILTVKELDDCYEISVIDNGCGFDPDKAPDDNRRHIGIQNARNSLKLRVGGTMEIQSKINSGTTVIIRIPKGTKEND